MEEALSRTLAFHKLWVSPEGSGVGRLGGFLLGGPGLGAAFFFFFFRAVPLVFGGFKGKPEGKPVSHFGGCPPKKTPILIR